MDKVTDPPGGQVWAEQSFHQSRTSHCRIRSSQGQQGHPPARHAGGQRRPRVSAAGMLGVAMFRKVWRLVYTLASLWLASSVVWTYHRWLLHPLVLDPGLFPVWGYYR